MEYNIDLLKSDISMKKFLLLFNSLSENCPLNLIIKLRKTPYKDLRNEQSRILKKYYSLEQDQQVNENVLKAFGEMLVRR